jgi:hypothetical protein
VKLLPEGGLVDETYLKTLVNGAMALLSDGRMDVLGWALSGNHDQVGNWIMSFICLRQIIVHNLATA